MSYPGKNPFFSKVNIQSDTGDAVSLVIQDGLLATQNDNNPPEALSDAYEPKNSNIQSHIVSISNPHNVTKDQIGLGNVPNVDATAPANIAQSPDYRFVSDTEKTTWNAKWTYDESVIRLVKVDEAASADILKAARSINGTSFNGSSAITTSKWGMSRDFTLGGSTKGIDGSTNISFSLTEIGAESLANKGANGGYCELDGGGKVPLTRLPGTILNYQSVWNASTNTPELTDNDISKAGFVFTVSAAGTRFGFNWSLGDWLIYNVNGVIEKSDNSDDVTSVNGQTGVVVLNTGHIAESTNLYHTDARVRNAISASGAISYSSATGVMTHTDSSTVRHVSDAEKSTWNSKADGSHTHSYAGSATAGGAADSVAQTLTRGTGLTGSSFNGSSATTWAVSYGTTAGTACQGNDSRLSDARTPLAHNQAWSTISSTPTTLSGYGISDAITTNTTQSINAEKTFSKIIVPINIRAVTASTTAVLGDGSQIISVNSSSNLTVTLPTNASVAFPVGTTIGVLRLGAGTLTIVGASGVTVRAALGTKVANQYTTATAIKIGSDEWVLIGNLQV